MEALVNAYEMQSYWGESPIDQSNTKNWKIDLLKFLSAFRKERFAGRIA